MEEFTNDYDSFKKYVADVCSNINKLAEDEDIPSDFPCKFIFKEELVGEVTDWAIRYLQDNKCPNLLATELAHELAKRVSKWDLLKYMENPVLEEDGREDNDKARTRGSEDKTTGSKDKATGPKDKATGPKDMAEVPIDKELRYEVEKLARPVFNEFHEVIVQWNKKWPYPYEKLSNNYPYGISHITVRNGRRKMEDRYVCLPYLHQLCPETVPSGHSYLAVFDGHGGTDAAIYATAHLHHFLVRNPHYKTDPATAMREAFIDTDTKFIRRAKREGLHSGSTGVSVLIQKDKAYVGWLGDSQCILVKDGAPVEIMKPHKPDRPDERQRIESQGGFVVWFGGWRVNATLSVSRAIGDAEYRPFVSGEPEVSTFDLTDDAEYVVIACDGLCDTLSQKDIAKEVYQYLYENNGERAKVAQHLMERAKKRGSLDNITIIVVFFKEELKKPHIEEKHLVRRDAKDRDDDDDSDDDNKDDANGPGPKPDPTGHEGHPDERQGDQKEPENKGPGSLGHEGQGHVQSNLILEVSRGEDPEVSTGEGRKVGRGEGHEVSGSEGHEIARGEGHEVIRYEGHNIVAGEGCADTVINTDEVKLPPHQVSPKDFSCTACRPPSTPSGQVPNTCRVPPHVIAFDHRTYHHGDATLQSSSSERSVTSKRSKRTKSSKGLRRHPWRLVASSARSVSIGSSTGVAVRTSSSSSGSARSHRSSPFSNSHRKSASRRSKQLKLPSAVCTVDSPRWTIAREVDHLAALFNELAK